MRLILAVCILIGTFLPSVCREYELQGRVFDAETGQRLGNATLTVTDPSGQKIVGRGKDRVSGVRPDKENWFMLKFYAAGSDSAVYNLRVELPGYKTRVVPLPIAPNTPESIKLTEPVWMVSDSCPYTPETVRELKEVTVTASRIKMVVRGDTLVYDAAAFQLSEGSMLDALVSQLPGVTLNSQGQIKVNGKFVSSLLVDGKDFFSGDPNVALRNLPAYVVRDIKVYERDGRDRRTRGTVSGNSEDLVMDVSLKKQYQQGFIANIEGGGGSAGRYQGRLFGLEYARNGRTGFFANVNNINNDSRGPGLFDQGWQNDRRNNEGARRIVKTGIDWQWRFNQRKDPDGVYTKELGFDGFATYTLQHNDLSEASSSTQFLDNANRFGRGVYDSHNRDEQFHSEFGVLVRMSRYATLWVAPDITYQSGHFTRQGSAADFGTNPPESARGEAIDSVNASPSGAYARDNMLLYRQQSSGHAKRHSVATGGHLDFTLGTTYPTGRMMNVYLDWGYRNTRSGSADHRRIEYSSGHPGVDQRLFESEPGWSRYLTPAVRLAKGIASSRLSGTFYLTYGAKLMRERGARDVYRLSDPDMPLEDAALDASNSFHSDLASTENSLLGEASVDARLGNGWKLSLRTSHMLRHLHRSLHYDRAAIDTAIRRNSILYTPELTLAFSRNSTVLHRCEVYFKAENTPVTMTRLFNTADSTDPLSIRLGNPDLKGSTTFSTRLTYERRNPLAERVLTLSVGHYGYSGRVGQLRVYNRASGGSTYMPINVSGSFRLDGHLDFTAPFAENKKFWLTSSTRADFLHNPDYSSESTAAEAVRETVRSLSLTHDLNLQWKAAGGCTFGLMAGATWRNAASSKPDFTTINALDVRGGLTANLRLPGGLAFATDISVTDRSGYEDSALDTTDWLWNARLERSWLRGSLVTKIDAYDILNRLSSINVRINSLGLTETWTNTMSRYVLLTLAWRFSIMPKK